MPVVPCALLLSDLSLTLPALSKAHRTPPRRVKSYTLIDFSELEAMAQAPADQFSDITSASRHSSTTSACLLEEELKSLGLYVQFSTALALLLGFVVLHKYRILTSVLILKESRPFS